MYVNTLISLEENMPTYGINSKRLNGHVTLSSPGIIRCYVQNLNTLDTKQLILYVFSSKENKGVRIGPLKSPKESRETKWQVDEKSVMYSGIMIRDIDAAAVVGEGNSTRDANTILIGFSRNKYPVSSILEAMLAEYYKHMSQNGYQDSQMDKEIAVPESVTQMPPSQVDEEIAVPESVTQMPPSQVDEEIAVSESVTQMPPSQMDEEIEIPDYITEMPSQIDEEIEIPDYITEMPFQMDEEIEIPDYITEMSPPQMDEEIEIPDYITQMPPLQMDEEFETEENMQDMQEFEMEDNDLRDAQYTKTTSHSIMERALKEAYIKQQNYGATGQVSNEETKFNKKKLREEDLQEESPEEINYLEEIEKKLKDIQARLKASDTLEKDIKRFQTQEFRAKSTPHETRDISSPEIQMEELANKLASLKNSIKSKSSNKDALIYDKEVLEEIYSQAESIQPFDYRTDQVEWVKISLKDLKELSALSGQWVSQPFVTFSYYKYNEMILGRDRDTHHYYVGVPDIYHPERRSLLQPEDKIQKFLCRKNVEPSIGEYGYWLISL